MFKVRRRHERLPTNRTVALQVAQWTGLEGICRDISYGGACLVLPDEVKVGDKLVFDLALDGGASVSLTAVVRHVTQLEDGTFAVGIAWAFPGAKHSAMLKAYVDSAA